MALKPKSRSGPNGSLGVNPLALRDLPRSTRQRKPTEPTESEYEQARLCEIQRRSDLYSLKLAKLKADLLDRAEVERAYVAITSAIRTVITGSKLSKTEKRDILWNLLTPAEFAENVARQSAGRAKGEASPVIGNGIDHATDP